MVFTFFNTSENKRNLWCSVRFSLTVLFVAVTYAGVTVQLREFVVSIFCGAVAIQPIFALHVGETLCRTFINIVANILGALLGWALGVFSNHEIGKAKSAFLLPVIFTLIALGIFVRSVKVVKDRYDYGPTAFLLAMLAGGLDPLGPDWLAKEFGKNARTLGIAYALTILSSFLPSFWAEDAIHCRVQENIDILASIYKGLYEEFFGENCMHVNLLDKPFLQPLQPLIDSKEKENSLSKFVSWELRWRHLQKLYKKIGGLTRRCACTIQSLSTYLTPQYSKENLHISIQLRETCREICSESAKALAQLSDSMKQKIAPRASTYIHVKVALDLAMHLKNTLEANDITSRLVESIKIIEELTSSIKELATLMPFKQFEQNSNVPELLIGSGSSQQHIPAIQHEGAHVGIDSNQPSHTTQSRFIPNIQQEVVHVAIINNLPVDTTESRVIQATQQEVAHVDIDINPPADTNQSQCIQSVQKEVAMQSQFIPAIQNEVTHVAIDINPPADTTQFRFIPAIQQEVAHIEIETDPSARTTQSRFNPVIQQEVPHIDIDIDPPADAIQSRYIPFIQQELSHIAIDIIPPADTTQTRFIPAIQQEVAHEAININSPIDTSQSQFIPAIQQEVAQIAIDGSALFADTTQCRFIPAIQQEVSNVAIDINPCADISRCRFISAIQQEMPHAQSQFIPAIQREVAHVAIDISPPTDTTQSWFIPPIQQEVAHIVINIDPCVDTTQSQCIPVISQEVATRTNRILAPIKNLIYRRFTLQKKFKIKRSTISDGPDKIQPANILGHASNLEPQNKEVARVAIDIKPPVNTMQSRSILAIPQEVATSTNQLVSPMKKFVSRHFPLMKKFKIKPSYVSDGLDTSLQPHVNLVPTNNLKPQKEKVVHVVNDDKPLADTIQSQFILTSPQEVTTRTNQFVAPIKKLLSRRFALKKKFKIKRSSVEIDLTQLKKP